MRAHTTSGAEVRQIGGKSDAGLRSWLAIWRAERCARARQRCGAMQTMGDWRSRADVAAAVSGDRPGVRPKPEEREPFPKSAAHIRRSRSLRPNRVLSLRQVGERWSARRSPFARAVRPVRSPGPLRRSRSPAYAARDGCVRVGGGRGSGRKRPKSRGRPQDVVFEPSARLRVRRFEIKHGSDKRSSRQQTVVPAHATLHSGG